MRLLVVLLSLWVSTVTGTDLRLLERSLWVNASLSAPKLGYWGSNFAPPAAPTPTEIVNAARILVEQANPNRLYLVHHHELPFSETARIFRDWRRACPATVDIVPTLVLRMYGKEAQPVFSSDELAELLRFFKAEINPVRAAVYDVLPKRDQGPALQTMAESFPGGLIRVGLQPDEPLEAPFAAAVEDTWSAFCHGLTNTDWQDHGFGRDTLRKWVSARNPSGKPVAYDLIVVAWDYSPTKRGEYPGYDDAYRNMPLPADRNRLAASEILSTAKPPALNGFSADLVIVEMNSVTPNHDGQNAFYSSLKAGVPYNGYYARPWHEVCALFQSLRRGALCSERFES